MNEASLDGPAERPESGEDWDELETMRLDEVRELVVVLGKALRAFQLYDENNPVYQRFVTNLREAFEAVWTEFERITLAVSEDTLSVGPVEVYRSESRSDSLAFLFYKDGVREITFLPGIETDQLTRFLSVLQRARQVRAEDDDLLTILWEEELPSFQYHYVDLLAEGIEVPESGPGATQEEMIEVIRAEAGVPEEAEEAGEEETPGAAGDEPPRPVVSQEDFNPTLYSLDARELQRLQEDIQAELDRDLRTDVLNALFDRLEESERPERQSEILGIFHQLLPNFLSRGVIDGASRVLRELSVLERKENVLDAERQREAQAIVDEVSSAEAAEELVRALEDGSIRPDGKLLGMFLGFLRPRALEPLLRAAETTVVRELSPILLEAVQGIAKRNPESLAALLRSDDAVVVAGAARLAGGMKLAEAGPILSDLMDHPEPEVRLAAVEAATELRASTAAGGLSRALDDEDRDVRIAAARAIGKLRFRPAAGRLEEAVGGKELRHADITEKIAYFEAYGMIGGDDSVDLLDRLLNGKGFLGKREDPETRACAALALGKVGSTVARRALEEATAEQDPVIRSAVNRALRGEA